MGLIIRNISGGPIEVDDIGIFLDTGEDYDLGGEPPVSVADSADLISLVQGTDLIALDPIDGISPLTIAQSVTAISSANDVHYRILGGEMNQLDDVTASNPPDGYVLAYNQINAKWEPVVQGGGGSGDSTVVKEAVNQVGHGFVTGTPIYFDGSNYQKAKADNINTLATSVAEVVNIDNFNSVSDGDIGGFTGLTSGSWYYVSDAIAGQLTVIEPANTYSNPVGYAESTTKFHVASIRASDLTNGSDAIPHKIINQVGHGFGTGTPIYYDGAIWNAAQSNSINTLATEVAVVLDVDNFEAIVVGTVVGLTGLAPGSWYFVSDTVPGGITTTEPTISNPIGIAESTSTLMIVPLRAVDYTNT